MVLLWVLVRAYVSVNQDIDSNGDKALCYN